jgi:hypothetical protein
MAIDLSVRNRIGQSRERLRRVVPGLPDQALPVDRCSIESGRGPGFETPHAKAKSSKRGGETNGRLLANPPCWNFRFPDVDKTAEKCPGGDDDRFAAELPSIGQPDTRDFGDDAFRQDVLGLPFDHGQPGDLSDFVLHCFAIQFSIGLRTGAANGRSLSPVENPELDPGLIGDPPHQSVQCVNLTDEMALA